MSTNTIILLAVAGLGAYMLSQRASEPPSSGGGATPAGGAPGFGFNLGFFKND